MGERKDISWVKLPPTKAIEYLQAKGYKRTFDYEEMLHSAHHRSFTVAKIAREDLLEDIRGSILTAQKEGIPFEKWKRELRPTLEDKGWWGEVEAVNPDTGEVKSIIVNSRRLRTIYYTNMRVAYSAGRAKDLYSRDTVQYLRYISILDARARDSHKAMHGKILHKNHPWWEQNFPPNGWGCRCRVSPVSKGSITKYRDRGDLVEMEHTPKGIASKDWSYDVRDLSTAKLDTIAAQKLGISIVAFKKLRDRSVRQTQLDEMVEEVIVKGNQKYPVQRIEIGEIEESVATQTKEKLEIDIENLGILLEQKRLRHARPERKKTYGHNLRVEEYRRAVEVLETPTEIYIDLQQNNLIYTFDDIEDREKINKIIIQLNKRVKKYGKTNTIATFGKVERRIIERDNNLIKIK